MRLRLSKSSRLLQRVAFLDLVFLSYSRNKFHTCSIRCDACPSSPSIICVPCYLLTKLLTKAPSKVRICITTEKALVRFTKRIWQLPGAGVEILKERWWCFMLATMVGQQKNFRLEMVWKSQNNVRNYKFLAKYSYQYFQIFSNFYIK